MVYLAKIAILGFLTALGFLLLAGLLSGSINTRYLFYGRNSDGAHELSPARVQLLLFTLGVAFKYLLDVSSAIGSGSLPDVSGETLALLGGSHAVYLGGKAYSTLLSPSSGTPHPRKEKEKK